MLYMQRMAELSFTGTVLRIEPDGFGVVEFDHPIGPQANTHGIFSSTLGSTVPYRYLRPGVHVSGVATVERNSHTAAAVKTLQVIPSSA
jgi:hypothetical protein